LRQSPIYDFVKRLPTLLWSAASFYRLGRRAFLVVHIAFQPRRSGNEEALLAEVSP